MPKPKFDLGKTLLAGNIGDFDHWRAGFDPNGELTDEEAQEAWAKYSEIREATAGRVQMLGDPNYWIVEETRRRRACPKCGAQAGECCKGDLTGIDVPWNHPERGSIQ